MKRFELLSFPDEVALSHAAAAQWLATISPAHSTAPRQCVALSGGRIARSFFSALTTQSLAQGVSLTHLHFFWADERCVPPTDPESNFALAQTYLFEPLAISPTQIHRIPGEHPPEAAAAQAAETLRRLAPKWEDGLPALDFVFLGMGEDGHVASLFPDTECQMSSNAPLYLVVSAPKPPRQRISLNYSVIVAARHVWILISGSGKQSALAASMGGNDTTPLSRVLNRRIHSVLWKVAEA